MELLTSSQMRAVEQAAITAGDVTGLQLMESAGAGVVAAVFEAWPEMAKAAHRAVILCGPGNNGGDGFVIARLLAEAGWQVEVFTFGDMEKLPPDAAANYQRWIELNHCQSLPDGPGADLVALVEKIRNSALVVDALFGTGLTRAAPDVIGAIAQAMPPAPRDGGDGPCGVAVDIPSGLCADSGRCLGSAIPAALTVTFHRAKLGHYLSQGPELCGKVVVADIGLSDFAVSEKSPPEA